MSDPTSPIGVTGATGRLGGRVARRLAAAGVAQRVPVRDLSRAPQLPGSVPARAPFDDPAAVRTALAGVPTVLMVSASETPDRVTQHISFIDAAASAGVQHLIYGSFYGAAPDCTFTLGRNHYATEQHIRTSGLRFTFLRDNFYADFMAALVTAVLRNPDPHAGATYSLTGPEALSLDDTAATLSDALGRPVRYQRETVSQAYASRAAYGAPPWQLDAWVSTYTAIANGDVAGVTDEIPELTGHPATSLAELLRRGDPAYQTDARHT